MKQMKAWCDEPGHVVMQPFESGGPQIGLTVDLAGELHKHLGLAIEEAKRQADPFEKWWSCQEVDFPGAVWAAMGGCRFNKAAARKIWDSMVSAKEGR